MYCQGLRLRGFGLPLFFSMAAIAIRERAAEIRKLGAHIGLFEWVAWATVEHVEVKMLFGSNIVSLRAVFAAGMPQHCRTCLRVAAVRVSDKSKTWLSAVSPSGELFPVVNHYVIGIACGLSAANRRADLHRPVQ